MAAITITDLDNAKTDVDHIAEIANSGAIEATDRLGHVKDTISGAVYKITQFTNRGAWAALTAYSVKDLVSNGGVWYVAVVAHTSSAAFATDTATKWRIYQGVTTGDLSASSGSDIVGFLQEGTGAIARTVQSKSREFCSVLDIIPSTYHSAVIDGTSTYDASGVINSWITNNDGGDILIPRGCRVALGAPIDIKRGIRLIGCGPFDDTAARGSKLFLLPGSNCPMVRTPAANAGAATHYMALENLVFDGNEANQTVESELIKFWGAYVGSWIRNVAIFNAYGSALTLASGSDLQIDHLWISNSVSLTGKYAFDTNQNISGGTRDGLLNIDHFYVENSSNKRSGDPRTLEADRGNGARFSRLVTLNASDIHVEAALHGADVEACHVVNIASMHGAWIGAAATSDSALVRIMDTDTRAIKIGAMEIFGQSSNCAFVKKATAVTSNVIPDQDITGGPYSAGYSAYNSNAYGNIRQAQTSFANEVSVERVGVATPQRVQIFTDEGNIASFGYLQQADAITSIGSSKNQPTNTPKNFISVGSYGNDADNVTLGAPVYLGSRGDAGYLSTGALFLLGGYPVMSKGSNAYTHLSAVTIGTAAPAAAPPFVGAIYVDTANNKAYISRGTTSSTEWMILN